jgi:hypothetical protein
MPRYIAEFMPQQENSWLGKDIYPADPKGETEWDATEYVLANYTPEEIEGMVNRGRDETTDSLREDPKAPKWVREWDGPFEVDLREEAMRTVHVVLFAPKPEEGSIGGYDWYHDPKAATERYLRALEDSPSDYVALAKVEVPDGLSGEEVTEALEDWRDGVEAAIRNPV